MQELSVNGSSVTRIAGISLMVGFVLLMIASLLYPGIRTIDRVDQTDYAGALAVVADHARLAQVVNVVAIMAVLLYLYSFFVLFRTAGPKSGIAGSLSRFGIGIGLLGWAVCAVAFGIRHMVIHLLQRGNEEAQIAEQLQEFALTTHVASAGLYLAFIVAFSVCCFLLGSGLVAQCERMDSLKIASYGLILSGVGQLAVYLIAMLVPELGLSNLINYYFVSMTVGVLSLLVVGIGMFQGRSELAIR